MKVSEAWCCLCGAYHLGARLNPSWYAEGLRHNKREDSVKKLICPECVSKILDDAGDALRSNAPDSVVLAAAIKVMDEVGALTGHKQIDMDF